MSTPQEIKVFNREVGHVSPWNLKNGALWRKPYAQVCVWRVCKVAVSLERSEMLEYKLETYDLNQFFFVEYLLVTI
jgi:hypothetical protein